MARGTARSGARETGADARPTWLVTGGLGFVGRHVLDALRALPVQVRVADLAPLPAALAPLPEGWSFLQGDLGEPERAHVACAGVNGVVHLAARKGLVRDDAARDAMVRANVGLTKTLLAALDAGAATGAAAAPCAAAALGDRPRFVLLSSTGVYGLRRWQRLGADDAPAPENDYERSKLAAEALVRAWRGEWAIVRPSNVIGPDHPERHLATLLARLQRGALVPAPGAGAVANYVSVREVARVVAALVGGDAWRPGATVVVNDPLPMDEFLRLAAAAVGARPRTVGLPLATALAGRLALEWRRRGTPPLPVRKLEALAATLEYVPWAPAVHTVADELPRIVAAYRGEGRL